MSHTRYRYVGRASLPRRLSPAEFEAHFALPAQVLVKIKDGAERKLRLSLAAQVAVLMATGMHPQSTEPLPLNLMKGLCSQLDISETVIASVAAINKSQRTVWDHRAKARDILQMKLFEEQEHLPKLRSVMAMHALNAASVDELVTAGCHALFDANVVLPADRAIRDIARQAFQKVEKAAQEAVERAVEPQWLEALVELMFTESVKPGETVLEWLKKSSGKHAPKTIKEVTQKVDYLKSLHVHEWDLSDISYHRLRAYALMVQGRPPSETSKRELKSLKLQLVCFLQYQLMSLTDETIYRASRRCADLRRAGKDRAKQVREVRSHEYRQTLETVLVTAGDKTRTPQKRLDDIEAMVKAVVGGSDDTDAAIIRETLSSIEQAERVEAVLDAFSALDLQAANASKDLKVIKALNGLRDAKASALPEDFDASIVDPAWREMVGATDREQALRAFMAHAMERIRDSLTGGKMWVDYSGDYRSREDCLIPREEWDANKAGICAALRLELDVDKVLKVQLDLLKDGLQEVSKQLELGLLEVDEAGGVRIARLRAAEEDPKLQKTQAMLDKKIGEAQLAEVIIVMDRKTGFSEALLGRRAKSRQELLSIYGGLIAGATGMDAKGVATMVSDLNAADVS